MSALWFCRPLVWCVVGLALVARLVRYGERRQSKRLWPRLLLALAGTVGTWELASESYVVAQAGVQAYAEAYGGDYRRPASFGVIAVVVGLAAPLSRL